MKLARHPALDLAIAKTVRDRRVGQRPLAAPVRLHCSHRTVGSRQSRIVVTVPIMDVELGGERAAKGGYPLRELRLPKEVLPERLDRRDRVPLFEHVASKKIHFKVA